jgi:hypothetical protein
MASIHSGIDLRKGQENQAELLLGNADPGIAHQHVELVAVAPGADFDRALLGVLAGIVEQYLNAAANAGGSVLSESPGSAWKVSVFPFASAADLNSPSSSPSSAGTLTCVAAAEASLRSFLV